MDGTAPGIVIDTRPPAGTKVHEHSTVRLTVSQGPPPVPIPDLSGVSQQTATDPVMNQATHHCSDGERWYEHERRFELRRAHTPGRCQEG